MSNTKTGGGTLFGILTIFIVLKLIGIITWSWWWVLSPFWIPWCIIFVIAILVLIGFLVTISNK